MCVRGVSPGGSVFLASQRAFEALKALSLASMLFDHAVIAFVGSGASPLFRAPGRFAMAGFATVFFLRLVGRDRWGTSALWLGVAAVLSIVPSHAALDSGWACSVLNPLSTLALTAACVWALERSRRHRWAAPWLFAGALLGALALSGDYGESFPAFVVVGALCWPLLSVRFRVVVAAAPCVSVALLTLLGGWAWLPGALIALLPACWIPFFPGALPDQSRAPRVRPSALRRGAWLAFFPAHLALLAVLR